MLPSNESPRCVYIYGCRLRETRTAPGGLLAACSGQIRPKQINVPAAVDGVTVDVYGVGRALSEDRLSIGGRGTGLSRAVAGRCVVRTPYVSASTHNGCNTNPVVSNSEPRFAPALIVAADESRVIGWGQWCPRARHVAGRRHR